MQTKVYCIFLFIYLFIYYFDSLGKEMTDNPSNITAATKLFFSVFVIGMTCFNDI